MTVFKIMNVLDKVITRLYRTCGRWRWMPRFPTGPSNSNIRSPLDHIGGNEDILYQGGYGFVNTRDFTILLPNRGVVKLISPNNSG